MNIDRPLLKNETPGCTSAQSPSHRILACTRLLLAVAALATLPLAVRAQSTTADIVGIVTDSSGAVVSGATVTLTDSDTQEKRTVTTESSGQYTFTLLKPDRYSISIVAAGYSTSTIKSFRLSAGDRAREDSVLVIGATSQQVEVEAQVPELHADSSTLSTLVTEAATQELPLNGRNYINLVQVTSGATEGLNNGLSSGNRPDDRRQTSSVSVNGQSDVINNQLIDGMDNNERVIGSIGVRPSVDAIQEVNVQTNTFTAEVGRSAGAIINVITKTGTNSLHGSVYEFLRNDVLNAQPFKFGASIPKPEWRQNQFGGSLGGPIKKDRTFFFGDYEGFRLVKGQNPTTTTIPTLYEEQNPGNFSDNSAAVDTAVTTDGVVNSIDPVGLLYFKMFPAPNTGASDAVTNNYTAAAGYSQFSNTVDGRVDHKFNDSNLFFGRYTLNEVTTSIGGLFPAVTVDGITLHPGGNLGSYPGQAKSDADQAQLNYIHTFTPHLLLELKAGYTFLHNAQYPLDYGLKPNAAFGQANINFSSRTDELSPITISQGPTLGAHPPIIYLENTFQYLGTITWNIGKQSIKMGAGLVRRQDTITQTDSAAGSWTISKFSDLLAGSYTSVSRNDILYQPHNRTWEPHVYIQDDWQVSRNLTLNLGARYDLFTPYTDTNNILSNFDTDLGKIVVAGQDGIDGHGNIRTDYSNFAPRVGFAYTPIAKTVVRGGFGMSYAPENMTSGSALVNQPFTSSYGPCDPAQPATCTAGYLTLSAGLPTPVASSASNPTGGVSGAVDPHFKSTYLEQYNLAVEHEFSGFVASLAYVSELGRRLAYYVSDYNEPLPNTSAFVSGFNINTLRPYYSQDPNLTTVPYFTSKGKGSYNSLQAVLKRRLRNGLDVQATYTLAHGLDDSEAISNDGGDGFAAVVSLIPTLEYGNANLDVRHRITGTFNYALPFGQNLRSVAGLFGKGWQANGLVVWATGLPFSETNLTNRTGNRTSSNNSDRPNVVGNFKLSHPTIHEWFNTSAFEGQTKGTVGDERRNQIYGPSAQHVDLSLFKIIPIHDNINLEFRTEAFNVLNTALFAFPTASLGNTANGIISSTTNAYSPRVVQFAARVKF